MKVATIQCESCGDTIYSRARHDMNWCNCGDIAIDGGRNYTKICWKDKMPEIIDIDIDFTGKQLYDDWNKSINKLGTIKRLHRRY